MTKNLLRVAAYARVSMETEQLHHSLEAQGSYFREKISANPSWVFAGIYADYGISGTGTKNRPEFNRMITDCHSGLIDIILVKSISRFARNTVDCLHYTRMLKKLGVAVIFERENINSGSNDGELLLSLLASFAQEESRSISENVRWRIIDKFRNGIQNGVNPPYGYAWNGEHYIATDDASIVREIFQRYLRGESAYAIAWSLADRGVTGQHGRPLEQTTVKTILANPAYTGIKVLQKYYTTETHKRRINTGELDQYVVPNMYDPIISESDFNQAQEIMKTRSAKYTNKQFHENEYAGKVFCGCCGRHASRKTIERSDNDKWICNANNRRSLTKCNMIPLHHEELLEAVGSLREIISITICNDRIIITTPSRRTEVYRKYNGFKRRTGFSGKIICAICGKKLVRKTRTGEHLWFCHKGIREDEIRRAAFSLLGEHYEPKFAAEISELIVTETQFQFKNTKGEIIVCPRS